MLKYYTRYVIGIHSCVMDIHSVKDLIKEIEDVFRYKVPVVSAFDFFQPENISSLQS